VTTQSVRLATPLAVLHGYGAQFQTVGDFYRAHKDLELISKPITPVSFIWLVRCLP
jgi:hypothetical protein